MARNMDYREENKRLQAEINYRVIGTHMQEIRTRCGLTQRALAERMGIDTNYYGSLETGINRISFPRFIQFMTLTNADADYLLTGSHKGLAPKADRLTCACEERYLLDQLLDRCSNDAIQKIYIICKTLYDDVAK